MRDPETQELIDRARQPVTAMEEAMQEIDRACDMARAGPASGPASGPEQPDYIVSLQGEEALAYEELRGASRALSEHQAAAPALMERYRSAIARLSAVAAK